VTARIAQRPKCTHAKCTHGRAAGAGGMSDVETRMSGTGRSGSMRGLWKWTGSDADTASPRPIQRRANEPEDPALHGHRRHFSQPPIAISRSTTHQKGPRPSSTDPLSQPPDHTVTVSPAFYTTSAGSAPLLQATLIELRSQFPQFEQHPGTGGYSTSADVRRPAAAVSLRNRIVLTADPAALAATWLVIPHSPEEPIP
jgi:hypothetical protein